MGLPDGDFSLAQLLLDSSRMYHPYSRRRGYDLLNDVLQGLEHGILS